MTSALLPWMAPLLLVPLWLVPGPAHRLAAILTPWAALPALGVALFSGPPWTVEVPSLLLGARFGLDAPGRIFLLLTAGVWLASGIFARGFLARDRDRRRFFVLFLVAQSGNLALVLAQDVPGFYCAFVALTFAGYGLVVHEATPAARRAARVYLVMAVGAEVLLLLAFFLAANAANAASAASASGHAGLEQVREAIAQSPQRHLIVALLLAGFGVKAGALPLHVWLPLAYPVAPAPASAVLSGCLIKAGLLGWLRFLPLGSWEAEGWGMALALLGLVAAFYGVAVGLTQSDPRTILAYSSISQMGLINGVVGIGLSQPAAWGTASAAVALFALHHGLAKGALFLGAGLAVGVPREDRGPARALLLLPALALAGAPLTSGSFAKGALEVLVPEAPLPLPRLLHLLLPLASVATTVLMGRFLIACARFPPREHHGHREKRLWEWAGFGVLLVAVVCAPIAVARAEAWEGAFYTGLSVSKFVSSLWPVLVGASMVWIVVRRGWWRFGHPMVAAGDLLAVAEAVGRAFAAPARAAHRVLLAFDERPNRLRIRPWLLFVLRRMAHAEAALTRWQVAGGVLLGLLVLALAVLLGGAR